MWVQVDSLEARINHRLSNDTPQDSKRIMAVARSQSSTILPIHARTCGKSYRLLCMLKCTTPMHQAGGVVIGITDIGCVVKMIRISEIRKQSFFPIFHDMVWLSTCRKD